LAFSALRLYPFDGGRLTLYLIVPFAFVVADGLRVAMATARNWHIAVLRYVRVQGRVSPDKLALVENGVTISGVRYEPVQIEEEGKSEGSYQWLIVTIKEGKNREVRNIMAYLGLRVARLIRIAYGPFSLGKLPRGGIEEISSIKLRNSLKKYFDEGHP
jgi:pseudouridine synthase